MPIPAGTRFGHYEIRSLLGVGGAGEVYLATDSRLERRVALKILSSRAAASRRQRDLLAREARTASALNHPNILTVFDVGEVDGQHYIATELVDGVTLRKRAAAGSIKLDEILDVFTQVAGALAAAEAAGIVHCDIKPDNIMIREDGFVKVLDFGLAMVRAPGQLDSMKSRAPGVVRGTISYMSPEQLQARPVDSRSDVWSLGVVLYEVLAGILPFAAGSIGDVIGAILGSEPAPIATVSRQPIPPSLSTAITRSLSKKPADRQSSMRAFAAELGGIAFEVTGDPAVAKRVFRAPPPPDVDENDETLRNRPPAKYTSLPAELTPIAGRDEEAAELVALIRRGDVRLVTLTGPAGIGKTRLAIHVAHKIEHAFTSGALVVDLAPLSDAGLVASALARALTVGQVRGISSSDLIVEHLREKIVLVILDQFERVLEASALVDRILRETKGVTFLVTSQVRLRLSGEREFPVAPLSTPDKNAHATLVALSESPSVRLFVDRARAASPDFALDHASARDVAEICRRLDGLPLAIELAAARTRVLSPREILERLGDRFTLLSGGSRDLPDRQRTLRDALEWGYGLLSEDERELFRCLSVFDGSFDLDAAETICGSHGGSQHVIDRLESLVDKSMLRVADRATGKRYSMLETIREFGRSLLSPDESDALREAHATFYASLPPRLEGPDRAASLARLEEDLPNIRLALDLLVSKGTAERALSACGDLWEFWYVHGHYSEGRQWLGRALAMPHGEVPARAAAVASAGVMAFLQSDYDEAIRLLDEAVTRTRASGDLRIRAHAVQWFGSVYRERGEYDQSIDLHEVALSTYALLGDVIGRQRSLNYVAFSSWLRGDFERAENISNSTLRAFRTAGHTAGVAWSTLNLAAIAYYRGNHDLALQLGKAALGDCRATAFQEGIAWSFDILGNVCRYRNDHERGEAFLRKSLEQHFALGDRWRIASVLDALAGYALDHAEFNRAGILFGAAEEMRDLMRVPVPLIERERLADDRDRLFEVCDPRPAMSLGRTSRAADVVSYALRRIDSPR
jgi:predicted ATPase